MKEFSEILKSTCNPFSALSPTEFVNLSSRKAANQETKDYLLSTLTRGAELKQKFEQQCVDDDGSRLFKPVERVKVLNFAAEQAKPRNAAGWKIKDAECVRDVF